MHEYGPQGLNSTIVEESNSYCSINLLFSLVKKKERKGKAEVNLIVYDVEDVILPRQERMDCLLQALH